MVDVAKALPRMLSPYTWEGAAAPSMYDIFAAAPQVQVDLLSVAPTSTDPTTWVRPTGEVPVSAQIQLAAIADPQSGLGFSLQATFSVVDTSYVASWVGVSYQGIGLCSCPLPEALQVYPGGPLTIKVSGAVFPTV